jgi:hypothetical protein
MSDKYSKDENDLEDFRDFEEFYGLDDEEVEIEEEPKELDFEDLSQ